MAWLPAIATIAGSLIASEGQEDTNNTNMAIQQQNSAFNAEQAAITRAFNADQAQLNRDYSGDQAQIQRDFQQNQADTVWQRGVRDMQAAGLNPMLAYSQGGNPAPSGAMGTGSAASASAASAGSPGNNVNPWASAAASAAQWAQIQQAQAQTRKTEAEADEIESTLIDEEGKTKSGHSPKWSSLKAAQMNAETGRIVEESKRIIAQADLTQEQKKLVTEQIKNAIEENPRIGADTALKKINTILLRNDLPRMEAEAKYFKSPVGRSSPHNKYGPQTPFRLLEGLGERIINKWSAQP